MGKYSIKTMKTNLVAISAIAIVGATITATGCATTQTHKTNIGSYLNEGGPDRQAAQEGIVMLKNDDIGGHDMLPLTGNDRKVNVFGTTQIKYFYGGAGSGEITMPFYRDNLLQGLRKNPNIQVNETLAQAYEQYATTSTTSHANQEYDPTSDITQAKTFSDTAIVVLGRLYGEEGGSGGRGGDASNIAGSFQLSTNASGKYGEIGEIELLKLVCNNFNKVIVLLNTTNVLDMDWMDDATIAPKLKSVLYTWCGGEESGDAIADVLIGDATPSGKLPDTIAKGDGTNTAYTKYPSASHFGNTTSNAYVEDIYVGYRHFETFAPNDVRYHFGYGLSYTNFTFDLSEGAHLSDNNTKITIPVTVNNIGSTYTGKEVIQIYYGAPQGVLGKPVKSLIAYAKTDNIAPGQSQRLEITFNIDDMASYDDLPGDTNVHKWIMEQGNYPIYVLHHAGEIISGANTIYTHIENSTRAVTSNGKDKENTEALAPRTAFSRTVNSSAGKTTANTTTQDLNAIKSKVRNHVDNLIYYPMTQNHGIKLVDVYNNRASMGDFISQMNIQALSDITTAAKDYLGPNGIPNRTELIGGTTQILRDLGISTACNNDGPAGMRANFHSTQAPDGTMLAATFNNELIEKLYKQIGHEMIEAGSDELLGPGMDIHRDPLCGRNFEYFSEDPLLTGMMASYIVRGLQSEGIAATPKHFAANNQEANRHGIDDQISERSLREIHLRAFEIMTKQSKPLNIMTSYNAFNGAHTHSSFELINEVLRNQWGWHGMVMTDWGCSWSANPDPVLQFATASADNPAIIQHPARIRTGGDIYQSNGANTSESAAVRDSLNAMGSNSLQIKEAQAAAINIVTFIMYTSVFRHENGLPLFDYFKTLNDVKPIFTVEREQRTEPLIDMVLFDGNELSNFNSYHNSFFLFGSKLITNGLSKITTRHARNLTVTKEFNHINSINSDVLTLTVTNQQGDKKIYRIYNSLDSYNGTPLLEDDGIGAAPINVYFNGQKYYGFYKNQFNYENVLINDPTNVIVTADVMSGASYSVASINTNTIALTCETYDQRLTYTFGFTVGTSNIPVVNVNASNTTDINAVDDAFAINNCTIMHDDPDTTSNEYIGKAQYDCYTGYNIHVQQSGWYNVSPRVASAISSNQAYSFELRFGLSLGTSQRMKYIETPNGGWYNWIYMNDRKIYLESGDNRIWWLSDSTSQMNIKAIRITRI